MLDAYHSTLQELQRDTRRRRRDVETQRAELERQIARLVDAIADGSVGNIVAVGEKLRELEGRLADLPVADDRGPAPIDWQPNAVEIYKRSITDLSAALNADAATREEAITAIRTYVDRIIAYPAERRGPFDLELHGAARRSTQSRKSR